MNTKNTGNIETSGKSEQSQRKLAMFLFTVILSVIALYMMRTYLVAVFLAIIFSILLEPLYQFFKRKLHLKSRASTASITFIVFAILVILPGLAFAGMIVDQTVALGKTVRPWVEQQMANGDGLSISVPDWVPFSETLNSEDSPLVGKLPDLMTVVAEFTFNFINSIAKGSVGAFMQFFIFSYALYFFLGRGKSVAEMTMNLLPFNHQERNQIIDHGATTARSILKSVLIVGGIQGLLIALAFWVTGIDRPLFWGLIVAMLSAIPLLGSGLVWIPAAIYLLANGQPTAAVGMVIWGALVVGMVDNILRPKIVGSEANIPDLLIFLSILAGVAAFGFPGLLMGPVLMAMYLQILKIYQKNFGAPDAQTV